MQNGSIVQLQSRHAQKDYGSSSMETDGAENDQDLARALAASFAGANAQAAASAGAFLFSCLMSVLRRKKFASQFLTANNQQTMFWQRPEEEPGIA